MKPVNRLPLCAFVLQSPPQISVLFSSFYSHIYISSYLKIYLRFSLLLTWCSEFLVRTVEPVYNDIGLCNTSSITSHIL